MAKGRFAGETWRLSFLLTMPVALFLAGLALAGFAPLWAAGAGIPLLFALTFLVIRKGMRDLEQAAEAVGGEKGGARPGFLPAATIALAAGRVRRQRDAEMDAARRELALMHEIFAYVPAPLLLVNHNRDVALANQAAETLLERETAAGPLLNLIRDPGVIEAVNQSLDDGVARQVEFTLNNPPQRVFAASIAPLAGRDDEADHGALVLFEDQTVMRRLDEMRVDFVANASHELRTPLSTLVGYIETLTGPASEDAAVRQRFLDIMHSQATRMARLIDDLMSLSRIELDEHDPPETPVDLLPLVQDQVEILQLSASERQMSFQIDNDTPADPLTVTGDRDQLTQVVQNLVDNAIKYGEEGKSIRLELMRNRVGDRDEISLSVIDTGDGIAPEHVERLTERFYRVDRGRSRELGGTGLGLAIVKHIVNRHRGRLSIDSTLDAGSRFTVTLPAHGRATAVEPSRAAQ